MCFLDSSSLNLIKNITIFIGISLIRHLYTWFTLTGTNISKWGLRRSNTISLEWGKIDMQRKVAWIHPEDSKLGQAIGVALNDTACGVLRAQIGNHHKWVFVHTEQKVKPDGTKIPAVRKMRVGSNTAWRAALKRAGIENFRFHDLRHTWASWLIQSGVPLSVLQEMGGWESVEMVRRYALLAPNHLTQHAKQIDVIFSNDVPKCHSSVPNGKSGEF